MDSKELYQFNAQIAELGKEAPSAQQVEYLKVSMLAEIALQLAGINEKLNTITERGGSADLQNDAMAHIADMLHIIADKK